MGGGAESVEVGFQWANCIHADDFSNITCLQKSCDFYPWRTGTLQSAPRPSLLKCLRPYFSLVAKSHSFEVRSGEKLVPTGTNMRGHCEPLPRARLSGSKMGDLTGLPIPLFVGVVIGGMVSNVYVPQRKEETKREHVHSANGPARITEGLGYSMKIMSKR